MAIEYSEETFIAAGRMIFPVNEDGESRADSYGFIYEDDFELWYFCLMNCDEVADIIDSITSDATAGEEGDGTLVTKVVWMDRLFGIEYDMYYSLNLGEDADDPEADPTSALDGHIAGSYSMKYDISYKTYEKNALLSKYKRYTRYGESEGTTFSDAADAAVSSLLETTLASIITVGDIPNFKKSPHSGIISTNQLHAIETPLRRSNVGPGSTSPATIVTSVTDRGGGY